MDENINKGHIKDVNNRMIFKNHILCAQFLRDYSDIEILKDVMPEDIIDDTQKYHAYLGVEFEDDTVKRIRINGMPVPIFVISLIEHKSDVDYNIAMQLLRYMALIWDAYGKEQNENGLGNPRNQSYKYPPIIPIVYYEGSNKWTAGLHLQDRIYMSEIFKEYMPDFKYKLVEIRSYTNDELIAHDDEMSVFMMLNKIQTVEDLNNFIHTNSDRISAIINNANESVINTFLGVVWNLYMKLNVPPDEAERNLENVRDGKMGYWFENMEKMDIQAERRNTAEARAALEAEKAKVQELENELDTANQELNNKNQEVRRLKELLIKNGITV
ncbi:MAG: Rpn family recombination-promoting nuclease/putative transposase [Lachnospiraceae bacterium]|nr:Rpn family recombination-promoting nuclease/putative transposase [Lachnospiraceae bacterium]